MTEAVVVGNCSRAASGVLQDESAAFVAFSVGLALVDAIIICGNTLVILAVLTSDSLRSVTSLLITSLAVADLLVGVLVLPFSIANEVLGHVWVFGAVWCQIWLAVDVWMCTASIYNLVVISVERYVAILKPLHYPNIVTPRRGKLAVLGAWVLSFSISFPPMVFNWSEAFAKPSCDCNPLDNSPAYIVFSSIGSFFLPMVIICFVYTRIYGVVRRIAKEDEAMAVELRECTPIVSHHPVTTRVLVNPVMDGVAEGKRLSEDSMDIGTPTLTHSPFINNSHNSHKGRSRSREKGPSRLAESGRHGGSSNSLARFNFNGLRSSPSAHSLMTRLGLPGKRPSPPPDGLSIRSDRKRAQSRMSAELKAVKMVAIVTGVFIVCWLGFSLIYLLRAFPFCKDQPDCIPSNVFSVFFWLGYTNSALNPVLYAVFNRPFRRAFKKLLTCSSGY